MTETTSPLGAGATSPHGQVRLSQALAQCATLSWRGIVKLRRNPMGLSDVVVEPTIFLVLFGSSSAEP